MTYDSVQYWRYERIKNFEKLKGRDYHPYRMTEPAVKFFRGKLGLGVNRLLDIGCGYGRLSRALGGCYREYVGIDPVIERVAEASRLYPKHTFRQLAPGQVWPVGDDEFNAAVCCTVLQHLELERAQDLLANAYRTLRPGGSLYMWEGRIGIDEPRYQMICKITLEAHMIPKRLEDLKAAAPFIWQPQANPGELGWHLVKQS